MPGGTQGPNIFPPLLAVVCYLPRSCPCAPSLSLSLLLYSATPGSFGSASASLPHWLPSKGNSIVAVRFFSQDMSNPAPYPPSHLVTYWVCYCHLQYFLVWNMLPSSDPEDSSEALGLKDIKFFFLLPLSSMFHSHREALKALTS